MLHNITCNLTLFEASYLIELNGTNNVLTSQGPQVAQLNDEQLCKTSLDLNLIQWPYIEEELIEWNLFP